MLVYLVLFAFFSRLLRNSTSTIRLMLLKRMRPQARYLLPLLALVLALPTTPLPERFKAPFEHFLMLCTVFIYVDCTLPVERVREGLQNILKDSPLWNGKTCVLQVTEFTENTMQLRCLMSANSPAAVFDLRCIVRERMMGFLQKNYPQSLPTRRDTVTLSSKPPAEQLPSA